MEVWICDIVWGMVWVNEDEEGMEGWLMQLKE